MGPHHDQTCGYNCMHGYTWLRTMWAHARNALPTHACAQLGAIVYLKWEHARILVLGLFMLKSTRPPSYFQAKITMSAPNQAKHHTTNPSKNYQYTTMSRKDVQISHILCSHKSQ